MSDYGKSAALWQGFAIVADTAETRARCLGNAAYYSALAAGANYDAAKIEGVAAYSRLGGVDAQAAIRR
jgi:hypothetical protein